MIRHPTFQRLLALWQNILSKNGVGLTEEEERESNAAPRTRFQVAAIMEAQDGWVSQSIQQLCQQGQAAWAVEAVNGPWGDDTNTIPPNRAPGDFSWDMLLPVLRRDFRKRQQQLGIVARQRPRQHGVGKWQVYDLQKQGLTFWDITRRLFKLKGKTTYDPVAQRHYAKVRRAYRAACALIDGLD
jgi:hypothetical protein